MWIGVGLATLVVALLNVGAWTTEPVAGGDVMFHLIRAEEGIELLAEGRIHGWSDRYYIGSDLFLFYGPGLVWMVALVGQASFGLIDTGTALTAVVLLSLLLVPAAVAFLARSLGLSHRTAGIAALLSPTVSTVWGVGPDGVYQHGLITHQLGVVLWLTALGGVVRMCHDRRARWVVITAISAAYLAITSPILLSVLVFASAIGVFGIHLFRKVDLSALLRLLTSAVLGVGLAAFWLVPAIGHRELRGASTWWTAMAPLEFLGYLFVGGIVLPPLVGLVVIVAMVSLLRGHRHPASWFLVLVPMSYIAVEIATSFLPHDDMILAQFQNHRGLGTIGLVMVIPLAWLFERLGQRRALWNSRRSAMIAMTVLAVVVGLTMVPKAGLARPYPDPIPQMDRAAVALAELVPPGSRFAFARDDAEEETTATIAPKHWLAHSSQVPLLNGVGLETTRAIQSYRVGENIDRVSAATSSADLIRHGTTHVVTTRQDQTERLVESELFEIVWRDPPLNILAVLPTSQGDPAAGLTGATVVSARMTQVDRHHLTYQVETSGPGSVVIALGWSPHWAATLDGHPIGTYPTHEWMTSLDLPAGDHRIELRFTVDRLERIGVVITLATILALLLGAGGRLIRNQRVERSG